MYLYYYILGIVLVPGLILSIYAQYKVNSTYKKYQLDTSNRGLTALEVSKTILNGANIHDVEITQVSGELTDYYDGKNKVIALSKGNINSTSLSAIGVSDHEVGHALQDHENYAPYKFRKFVIALNNIASRMLWPLIIIGILLDFVILYTGFAEIIVYSVIGFYGLSVILNLATLSVEKNASKRAVNILQQSTILTEEETAKVQEVLNAAALTYVAALVVSILSFLRIILFFSRFKRDD